ncbi:MULTISPECIES: nuclease-related domain-containing protein [Streptosporangium]|uniref:Xanthosine utilization system XapX-like protein n=1 Tax=Streptosporangium brasiliense TaxID=47480 RepID=A0ABT9RBK3_9ACTN|nr:nuclease-related domain-containing protein [Streptosporangium brasiliense]MDP9865760.1 xanthosine utilization system XapX-like protein [Streptosporangium brasiliense]
MTPDDQVHGLSPQVMYEQFWLKEADQRRKMRMVKAAAGLVVGILLAYRFDLPAPPAVGLAAGLLVAGADMFWAWYSYEATAVWRGRRRGEVITGKLLRRKLRRLGYQVLDGRAVPGQASIDHLVIGPGGIWVVDNEAWDPETEIARYGDRLFLGEKYGTKVAKALVDASDSLAQVLSRESGIPVTIEPLLAVHGGRLRRTVTAEGLTLLKPRLVARWIVRGPRAEFDESQVELLARTAARVLRRMS